MKDPTSFVFASGLDPIATTVKLASGFFIEYGTIENNLSCNDSDLQSVIEVWNYWNKYL